MSEVNAAVGAMDKVTQRKAEMVGETAVSSQTLAQMASDLEALMGKFQLDVGHNAGQRRPA